MQYLRVPPALGWRPRAQHMGFWQGVWHACLRPPRVEALGHVSRGPDPSLDGGRLPLDWARRCLLAHAAVAKCALVDDVVYVVRTGTPPSSARLDVRVEGWELRRYLWARMKQSGLGRKAPPEVRVVDHFDETVCQSLRFTLLHILESLFRELGAGGSGAASLEDFSAFCGRTGLFHAGEKGPREAFFDACAPPGAADSLFSPDDFMNLELFENRRIGFYEFQKLMLDAGIVEERVRVDRRVFQAPFVSYFVDEHVADIVVQRWFAAYDSNGDGILDFDEYLTLIADYEIPFPKAQGAYQRLDTNADGVIDVEEFRALLEHAKVLETGASVGRDDEMGHVWRDMEHAQQFLPPTRVFVADGRQGTSPPKDPLSLRFVCVSDTHGQHASLTARLPAGDVLLHAGDFTMSGGSDEVDDFAQWLRALPFPWKVVIAGNHDLSFDRSYDGHHSSRSADSSAIRDAFLAKCGRDAGVIYLEDEECCVRGVRIYGTPWQPEFGYWAFNLPRGPELARKWSAVPAGIDILLVHGPPLGRGDVCHPSLKRTGCADLLAEVQGRIRPTFVVCGHLHEGAGVTFDGTTHFVNASSLTEYYECEHAPLVFDVPIPGGHV